MNERINIISLLFILQPIRRQSLDPPKKTDCSWVEYISSEAGHPPDLGRPNVSKESSKSFKVTVAMVFSLYIFFVVIQFMIFIVHI